MRSYEEFESLISGGGDLLFSTVLSATKSREKALEIIMQATEKYLDSRKNLKNSNEKYRHMVKICEEILKAPLPDNTAHELLTDEERDKILATARLYIRTGGKAKKRLQIIIVAGVLLVIVAIIVAYKLNFILSDEFNSGWTEWYKKEQAFRERFGWGH